MTASLYLLRHGERETIPEGTVGNEMLLTSYGLASSAAFGASLPENVIQIKTSPIQRCVQTAQMIARNCAFSESQILQSSTLGAPGIFISDGSLAWQHWEKHGSKGVNKHLLYGTEQWKGFKNLDSAAKEMMLLIEQQLSSMKDHEVAIWVTHDTILATLVARTLTADFNLGDWPDYLGFLQAQKNKTKSIALNYHRQAKW